MPVATPRPAVIRPDDLVLTKPLYPIGELSEMFGLSLRAIRFYCDFGLIQPCEKHRERIFDQCNVRRLALIRIGTDLGFSLREVASMLRSGDQDERGPYLEIASERLDQEIVFLTNRRVKMAEQLRSLLACKRKTNANLPVYKAVG